MGCGQYAAHERGFCWICVICIEAWCAVRRAHGGLRRKRMIELGKVQELMVVRIKDFGVYLSEDEKSEASVLLPKKQVPQGTGQKRIRRRSFCSGLRTAI